MTKTETSADLVALQLLRQHGSSALAYAIAVRIADQLRGGGDSAGETLWRKVAHSIHRLGGPDPGSDHAQHDELETQVAG